MILERNTEKNVVITLTHLAYTSRPPRKHENKKKHNKEVRDKIYYRKRISFGMKHNYTP